MSETERTQGDGYEHSDVPPSFVVWTGVGLLILVGLVAVAAGVEVHHYQKHHRIAPSSAVERTALTPPEPRLQQNPVADLRAYNRRMDQVLGTYGWIDRKTGTVRIPISAAMARLAVQGWPHPTADTGVDPAPSPTPGGNAP